MRALCPIFGQKRLFRRNFVQKLADRERVPDLYRPRKSGRAPGSRAKAAGFPRGVGVVGRDDNLFEVNSGQLDHQPAAQRPGRVVLAAQGQRGAGHGSILVISRFLRKADLQIGSNPYAMAYRLQRIEAKTADRAMMYDAYQAMADVGDRVRSFGARARSRSSASWRDRPYASPLARMAAYYEVVALAGFTHERPDYGIESIEVSGRAAHGEPARLDLARRSAICCISRRRAAPTIRKRAACRADVRPFRDAAARHGAHAAARPSGLHHRLGQPAQRQAGGRAFRPGGLHAAPDRFRRATSATSATSSRSVSRLRFRARRDRRHGDGRRQCATGEPDADGRADRRARRAQQGQQAREREALRMVSRQPDRRRALEVRGPRPARLSRLPAAIRLHEHELRSAIPRPSSTSSMPASTAITRRPTRSRNSTRNISRSWT